jgi:hypothetical protein
MRGFRALQLVSIALIAATAIACGDTQYITVEEQQDRRRVGEACVLDDQCQDGRCVAGFCSDGSCEGDDDCSAGEICVFGACESADDFACTPTQQPLVTIDATTLDFGEVALGNSLTQTLHIGNDGDCLLTISGVGIRGGSAPGFGCEPCDVAGYPQRIPPGRSLDVDVTFAPTQPGEATGYLDLRSDDETAGDQGLVSVDLYARYSGVPVLVLDPGEINFGYVEYAAGGAQGERTEIVKVMNQGTGNATLTVQFIYLMQGTDFSIPAEFAAVSPAAPRLLPPYNPNDPSTWIEVPVTFRPTDNHTQETQLTVNAHSGDPASAINVAARVVASSLGPPQIAVSATELVYQQDDQTAYPVGMVAFRQVTIQNTGMSELAVDMSLSGESSDFSISPPFVPPIAAGGSIVVSVFFNPSAPSDPANPHDPTQPFNAVLNITSNDDDPATDVLKTVALRGWSKGGLFDDVLKLEMTFENADNSWAGNDFRDVDLELVSPLGLSCAKPQYAYLPAAGGGFTIDPNNVVDLCDEWNEVDTDGDGRPENGTVTFIALGQYQEPERILLFGLEQDLANGQVFEVRANYAEDCANIPTGIFSDVLGIGVSALLGVLGGSIGVPIAVNPSDVSDLIQNNCWDHASSLVTLHITINGTEVAAPQQRIQNKGDTITLARLKREDGQFTILP